MGNHTDVSRMCCEFRQAETQRFGEDILHTEYILPCQICTQNIKHSQFKEHLDQHHYAEIQEVDNCIQVKCLLCEGQSHSLEKHAKHINKKHTYAVSSKTIKGLPLSIVQVVNSSRDLKLNKRKKQIVSKIVQENDYQLIKNEEKGLTAQLNSQTYSVDSIVKEYRGSDYQPNQVIAELIWFNIFKSNKDYLFYYLSEQPKQKSILCKAYFFYSHK